MTTVRKFHPEVRLKRLLSEAGGIRAADALTAADVGVESMRDRCMQGIDAKIEKIALLVQNWERHAASQTYALANEIFSEAGMFGLKELSEAGLSLCELLGAHDAALIPEKAVRVHVDAMRALRSPAVAAEQAMRQAVLGELRKLSQRYAE